MKHYPLYCAWPMKRDFTVRRGALDGVEAFLSVAKLRSFRRAAAELTVTPSAISQAVRSLEARVGRPCSRARRAASASPSRPTIHFARRASL